MKPRDIINRLEDALRVINRICDISGVPGASIGVLHEDQVIYTRHIGHRDVAAKLPPTSDTIYGIGSLTKGFVAASLEQLLSKHPTITWTSPIQDILPEYQPEQSDLDGKVALIDFLSHRTGLSGDMSIALQGDLEFILAPSDTLPAVSRLHTVAPFRKSWVYNNWGYSVAGAVIEKLSGKPAYQYIRETILDPLGLANTTTRPVLDQDSDFAEAYSALEDGTPHHLPRAFPFNGSLFELAGGMFSTVNDMLKYAQAILRAQTDPQSSPLGNLEMLFQGHIPLVQSDESFGSYGMGWIATHLPGVIGLQGDNAELLDLDELPRTGNGENLIKTFYHQGAGLGYYSAIYLFPETKSGFVVLTNSMPLNDAADWIAQVVATALHGSKNTTDYVEFAQRSRQRKVRNVSAMKAEFDRIRQDKPTIDPRPLQVYCGRYRNAPGNFFIDIRQSLKDSHLLELVFLGREKQAYQLRNLQGDVFEWAPDYDEQARRARFTRWDTTYFQIVFHFKDEDEASSLEWAGGQTLVALRQSTSMVRDGLIDSSGDSDSNEL